MPNFGPHFCTAQVWIINYGLVSYSAKQTRPSCTIQACVKAMPSIQT